MSELAYRSKIHIRREEGPIRYARLPAAEEDVVFGAHGPIYDHYGMDEGRFEDQATTLDYVVAAAAG
ncbi:MAG: hypothetical protein M3198_10800 [Actinomycetota bacterium]|nr:hypothetical protein [Actinomycetota bacterium]